MREPASARRGLIGAASLALVAACSGDGAAPAPTTPPTIAVDDLPAAIDTTSAPAVPLSAPTGGPTFRAGAIVAPAGDRPWLLVGSERTAPGEPSRLAVFASDRGDAWAPTHPGAADHTAGVDAYGRADGTVIVAGAVDGADGLHPAVWQWRDGVLAVPEVLDDVRGTVVAVAPDAMGAPMLLLTTPDGPAVARATADGWSAVLLPGGGEVRDIGVSSAAVVVTGTSIWRSTDGAASFEATQAPPVLGAVVGGPGGFVAASCATGGQALSPDGAMWTDVAALHPRLVAPVPGGGCGALVPDDEGGVWLASAAGEPTVFRIREQLVDRLGVPPRPAGTIFDGQPLVAVAGGTVVVAVPQPGGVATSAASAVTLTTDLELDVALTPTSGVTLGHAAPVAVVPLDDGGRVVGVATFPVVTDAIDGSFRWTTSLHAGAVDDTGALVADDRAAPVGPSGSLGGIVGLPAAEVSLATVADRGSDESAPGATGDVVLSRHAGRAWSAREVALGGSGRQAVNAVVAGGDVAVGVGDQMTTDPAGVAATAPLVVVTDGSTVEVLPVDTPARTFFAACRGPDSTVVAIGADDAGATFLTTVDAAAGTTTTTPGPPGAAVTTCAGDGSEVLLAGERSLHATSDGATFEAVGSLRSDERVTATAVGPAGFAVTGTTATGDAFVLAGESPAELRPIAAPGIGGVGEHVPTGLVVRDTDLVVLGLADGAPASWRIAIG